jgi:hypothetical protein
MVTALLIVALFPIRHIYWVVDGLIYDMVMLIKINHDEMLEKLIPHIKIIYIELFFIFSTFLFLLLLLIYFNKKAVRTKM